MRDKIKCFYEDDPPKIFVAIFSDGSGCDIFYKDGEKSYNSPGGIKNVPAGWFVDAGYLWFIQLPDDFKVWK
jgi:hypothetical protein